MEQSRKPQPIFFSSKQIISDFLLIISGCILCAIAINGILVPQHFATSGITGIALILHKIFPQFNIGIIYFLCNVPLFALAWMAVGRRFFFYSLVGMAALSLSVAFIQIPVHLEDKILNALWAGLISGTGVGLTLRSSGSQGGIDILSVMLLKRFSIGIGNTILAVNCLSCSWSPLPIPLKRSLHPDRHLCQHQGGKHRHNRLQPAQGGYDNFARMAENIP